MNAYTDNADWTDDADERDKAVKSGGIRAIRVQNRVWRNTSHER